MYKFIYNFIQEQDIRGKTFGCWEKKYSPFIRIEIKGTSESAKTAFLFSNVYYSLCSEKMEFEAPKADSNFLLNSFLSQVLSILCTLICLKAILKLGAKHCKIVFFILINERNSKDSMKHYLKKNSGLIGSVAQVILVESVINDYSRIWMTESTKGMIYYHFKIPISENEEYVKQQLNQLHNSLIVNATQLIPEITNQLNKEKILSFINPPYDKNNSFSFHKICSIIPIKEDSLQIYNKIKELISYVEINESESEFNEITPTNYDKIEDGYAGLKIKSNLLELIDRTSQKYFPKSKVGIIDNPLTIYGLEELANVYNQSDLLIFGLTKIGETNFESNGKFIIKFMCLLTEIIQSLNQFN